VSRSAARERTYGLEILGFGFVTFSSSVAWSGWPRDKDADEGESSSRSEPACGGGLSVKGL
jgi:hypothetical protein